MVVDVAFGFLGSGKTTFISKVLKEWGKDEKIVVLVNEFGDVGIDIVNATVFKGLYKANRRFIESQAEGTHLVLMNKCDRVDKRTAMLTQSAIS